ncbi:class I SAM-dependent methyltransferase [Pontibacter cellulosilyticus]|uniref:Class I SAM-dependent methyltransferase n=1 Tax=Pontibacter cellulosilyticus TaxID=1720253 RepID=A0A923SIG1_9BACT|nr:class I SAM-dependent methyltransferase [Pontibacter cellulosilyticus]MBC5991631.1 class I SAM-dependent methyltransferase [Pontibacter cellulosilyticus]
MNNILEEIFENKEFVNFEGQVIKIHSETNKSQCEFLQQIISQNKFSKSIEIGFAFGTSTLAIVEEIEKNKGKHVVIDKFQHSDWGGNGLNLIKAAGYESKIEFFEQFCFEALPKLMFEGRRFDFAYIDSTKQFDWILVNFFYLDKLLEINGVIVFDDVTFPGIRKVLRYISQFPNYKVYSQHPKNHKPSKARSLAGLLKLLPLADKLIKDEILISDSSLQINSGCVAIKKISEDTRNWDWHVSF